MRRSKRMKRILREHISTLALILITFLALRTSAAGRTEAEAAEAHAKTQRVQDVIDDLRGRCRCTATSSPPSSRRIR